MSSLPGVWGITDDANGEGIPSGAGYQRIVLPFDQLNANSWLARYYGAAEMSAYQVVVAQRLSDPDYVENWRELGRRHALVYETDDNVFAQEGHAVYQREDVQQAVRDAADAADLVTVSTPALAEVMTRECSSRVTVLPNFIPAYLLEMTRPQREQLTVGWAGSFSHEADFAMIAPILREFAGQVSLHLVGTDFRSLLGCSARFSHDWNTWEHERYYQLIDFDVGVAPLTGSVFNASRSHLKALEYAALGIPVIASDCEPYRYFVQDGVTGFLVRTDAQWRDRLRLLTADVELRTSMGLAAKKLAGSWTIESNWNRWDDAYRSL